MGVEESNGIELYVLLSMQTCKISGCSRVSIINSGQAFLTINDHILNFSGFSPSAKFGVFVNIPSIIQSITTLGFKVLRHSFAQKMKKK